MTWDNTWEQVFRTKSWGKYPGEDLVRFVARNYYGVENRSLIKILEVGAGTGANLWFMAREGFSVYGIDGSETAVSLAVQRLDDEVPGWSGEVIVGDILDLPYQNDSFDAVIDIEALSCNDYASSKKIYAEMSRVLKPGGKLYSRTFATGTLGEGTGKASGHNAWQPAVGPLADIGLVRFTDEEEIRDLVCDLQIVDIDMKIPSYKPDAMIREWMIQAQKPAL